MSLANTGLVSKSQPWILRSTYTQTTTGLLWTTPSLFNKIYVSGTTATSSDQGHGFEILDFQLHNRSGSAAVCGIGGRLINRLWIAGQWDDDQATAYTDDTTDAQDAGAGDFALETTTNNDGFVVACRIPFHWVAINVTTAGVDGAGSTDRAVRYSNATGNGWTNITGGTSPYLDTFTSTNTVWAAGGNYFIWQPPADWGPIQTGGYYGIPEGYYALNIRTTDAPDTTVALAGTIEVGLMPFIAESVTDNAIYSGAPANGWLPYCDGLVAAFGTANAGNSVIANVRARG